MYSKIVVGVVLGGVALGALGAVDGALHPVPSIEAYQDEQRDEYELPSGVPVDWFRWAYNGVVVACLVAAWALVDVVVRRRFARK